MREAFRLNQDLWTPDKYFGGAEVVWMYYGKPSTRPEFSAVEPAVRELMKKATTHRA